MELTKNQERYQEARFQAFTDEVLRIEGGYVNDPHDPGGETNHGITWNVARAYGYQKKMIDMTKNEAKEIYRRAFWNGSIAENIMHDAAFHLYLLSIHAGKRQAILLLQRAVGVKADGIFGTETMNAVSKVNERLMIEALCYQVLDFYVRISPKTNYRYLQGWRNRLLRSRKIEWKERIDEYERSL